MKALQDESKYQDASEEDTWSTWDNWNKQEWASEEEMIKNTEQCASNAAD